MKKLVMVFITAATILLNCLIGFAAEDSPLLKVTLSDAVSKAMDNDKTARIKDIEIGIKNKELDISRKNAQDPSRTEDIWDEYDALSTPMKRIWKEIIPLEKEYGVESLQHEKIEYGRELGEKAKYTFYKALYLSEQEKIANEKLQLAKKDFEIVEGKYKLGLVSQISLDEARIQSFQAEYDYLKTTYDRDNSYDDVRDLTGLEITWDISLEASDIKQYELKDYNAEEFIGLIKENYSVYLTALKNKEFQQKRYDIYKGITRYGIDEQELENEKQLLFASTELKKVTKDEIIAAYSEYIELQNFKYDIEVSNKNLSVLKLKLDAAEKQREMGSITDTDYLKQKNSYEEAHIKLNQDINEYNYRVGKLLIKIS